MLAVEYRDTSKRSEGKGEYLREIERLEMVVAR